MKREKWSALVALTLVMAVLSGCGASETTGAAADDTAAADTSVPDAACIDIESAFTDRDLDASYDAASAVDITLTGESARCESSRVSVDGSTVTITGEGTYVLRGTLRGTIVVDADKSDKVQLVLCGAEITADGTAAVYVRQADKVFLTLAQDTDNALATAGDFTAADESNIDAAVFSKDDLTMNGTGSLIIAAPAGHGVVSKDDLVITGGTYTVSAGSHGFSGKESLRVADGRFTVTAGKDGFHAEDKDDESLGWLYIRDGDFTVMAEDDGLSAAQTLRLDGGNYNISTGDDGIHGDGCVTLGGGSITITASYEGIEGRIIAISGGDITLTASDDGLNAAAGGADRSGMGGMNGGFAGGDFAASDCAITISGGTLRINAAGDGIDSNGSLTVTGGEVYVSGPTDGNNGALDYGAGASISGGTFAAAGSTGMAQNFGEDSTQCAMLVSTGTQAAGTTVTLTDSDGKTLITYTPDKDYACVVLSAPALVQGGSYTLTAGSFTAHITMDSLLYSDVAGGMGGMNGGMGHGGQGGFHDGAPTRPVDGSKPFRDDQTA